MFMRTRIPSKVTISITEPTSASTVDVVYRFPSCQTWIQPAKANRSRLWTVVTKFVIDKDVVGSLPIGSSK